MSLNSRLNHIRKEEDLSAGVNQGLSTHQPELVAQVETCDHPDYRQSSEKSWDCVACSLTVITDRKPTPGARDIV